MCDSIRNENQSMIFSAPRFWAGLALAPPLEARPQAALLKQTPAASGLCGARSVARSIAAQRCVSTVVAPAPRTAHPHLPTSSPSRARRASLAPPAAALAARRRRRPHAPSRPPWSGPGRRPARPLRPPRRPAPGTRRRPGCALPRRAWPGKTTGNPRDTDWDGAKLSESAAQCEQEPMSVESRQRYLPTAVSASRQQSRHQPHSRDTASDPFNGKKNQLENSLASTHVGLASGPQSLLGKP